MTKLYDNLTELSDILDNQRVSDVRTAVVNADVEDLHCLLDSLHPADVADLLEQISDGLRGRLLDLWKGGINGEVLSELDESIREDIIDGLNSSELADAVRHLETDDVVNLVETLDEPQKKAILKALDDAERVIVEQSLSYPNDSAGRLMQREVVMAPEHWNIGQAIDYLQRQGELPEQFYHIILVDPRMRPTGYVALGQLLGAKRAVPLRDVTEHSFRIIPFDQPEGEVAYAFNQYHLISAPVVDSDDRLVGVITIDDAMVVLDEEHEEDLMRLAGVGDGSLSDRVIETIKRRFPWLAVNLCTAIIASLVISIFEATITQVIALAVLMPIVASMGGNAGTQSLTVAVRAIATKDLTTSNVWRVIRREVLVGLGNGIIFAVVLWLVGFFWFGSSTIGCVLAMAIVVNMVIAGFAGTVVPVLLEKMGVDPALAAGAFVTTVTDVVGFFAFLGLAAWVLL